LADNNILAVIGILIAIFSFLLVLLGIGQYFGGSWNDVAQGVAKFILVITVFALGVYTLFYLVGRR
jgi:hypothetical protein